MMREDSNEYFRIFRIFEFSNFSNFEFLGYYLLVSESNRFQQSNDATCTPYAECSIVIWTDDGVGDLERK